MKYPGMSAALAIEQAMAACEVTATVVGVLVDAPGLRLLTPEGDEHAPAATGFQHFQGLH